MLLTSSQSICPYIQADTLSENCLFPPRTVPRAVGFKTEKWRDLGPPPFRPFSLARWCLLGCRRVLLSFDY